MTTNLLAETEKILEENGVNAKLIRFISNAEGLVDIAQFMSMAKHYDYDNQSPRPMVDATLHIVGGSWWMSRIVVHGTERWLFHRRPQRPTINVLEFTPNVQRPQSQICSLDDKEGGNV